MKNRRQRSSVSERFSGPWTVAWGLAVVSVAFEPSYAKADIAVQGNGETPKKTEPEPEEVEAVEAVEVIEEAPVEVAESTRTDRRTFTLLQIIGRNHPAAVHIPIGLVLAVLILELLALFWPKLPLGKSSIVLSVVTVASFVPASLSGFIRSTEVFRNLEPSELLLEHRNIMIAMMVVFFAALVLRLARRDNLDGALRYVYFGLLLLSFVLVAAGGHHGGRLVYGENFLPY